VCVCVCLCLCVCVRVCVCARAMLPLVFRSHHQYRGHGAGPVLGGLHWGADNLQNDQVYGIQREDLRFRV
jgi:hypothetical protein